MATINKKPSVRKTNTRYVSNPKSSRAKSRTGPLGLARNTRLTLFTKRYSLIAAGMAAIAGLAFVALSFAGGTPDYQYSLSEKCVTTPPVAVDPAVGANPTPVSTTNTPQTCKDLSAEGMVYRLYRGLLGRNPDPAGYQYWTQKLAGDRINAGEVIRQMGGAKMITGTDDAFISALYTNMMARPADARGKAYWLKNMKNKKKWSRQRVVLHFVSTREAKRKNQAGFNTFLASASPVKITQKAAAEQKKRYEAIVAYTKAQGKNAEAARKNALAAQNALNAAKSNASGGIGRERLAAIAANQKTAEGEYNKAKANARTTESIKKIAIALKNQSDSLYKHATDIKDNPKYGKNKFDANYKLLVALDKNADKAVAAARQRITDVAAQYEIAEAKYEAEQNRLATEAAARRAAEQSTSNQGGGGNGATSEACPPGQQRNSNGTCYSPTPREPRCDSTKRTTQKVEGNGIRTITTWQSVKPDKSGCFDNSINNWQKLTGVSGGAKKARKNQCYSSRNLTDERHKWKWIRVTTDLGIGKITAPQYSNVRQTRTGRWSWNDSGNGTCTNVWGPWIDHWKASSGSGELAK